MDGNFTLFRAGGGGSGGSGSGDYVIDNFLDTSVPATNNTGFSSTVSTNPIGAYFADNDSPSYEAKTLWIKDLVLLEQTQWINRQPTYKVIFNEEFPSVFAYASGNVRLLNFTNGISASVRGVNNVFGVSGIFQKVAFLCNPSQSTGTADIVIDGADTGSDITFGTAALGTGSDGYNVYDAQVSSSSNQTLDIHDFRIQANENLTLSVAGIIVYFQNSGSNIQCFPGSTYLNKTKITTTLGATLSVPTIGTQNGAITNIYKTTASAYALSTNAVSTIASVAVGANGGTSIDVTTGQGGSFLPGSGIVSVSSGSSYYVGKITSISTDTLTVSPALPFNVSGPIYMAWNSGPTYAIDSSVYSKAFSFDPGISSVNADANGFKQGSSVTDYYYSDPYKRYRVWGDALQVSAQDGTVGVAFNGASPGFLQVTGDFSAADLTLVSAPGASPSVANFSVAVNGTPTAYTVNEGYTGTFAKTLFTNAGPGINSVVISAGASIANCVISKIDFYKLKPGVGITNGLLAYFETHADKANRTAYNASMMQLGMHMRTYADELYLKGSWTRGTTHSAAGGVFYLGPTTSCQVSYGYYGTDFTVIGANASVLITLNGATSGLTQSFNTRQSVATLGFHSVAISNLGPSTVINAIDHYRPRGEIVNNQNYLSTPEQDDAIQVFNQSATPRNPKPGDVWMPQPGTVWMYFMGVWNKLSVVAQSDDPNSNVFVKSHGFSGTNDTTPSGVTEMFNLSAWSQAPTSPIATAQAHGANGGFNFKHYLIGGQSSGTSQLGNSAFNKAAWNAETTTGLTARGGQAIHLLGNVLYLTGGAAAFDPAANTTASLFYNGNAWTAGNVLAASRMLQGCFTVNNIMSLIGGWDGGGTAQTGHVTKNTSDTIGSATAIPAASGNASGGEQSSGLGFLANITDVTPNTVSYSWNGSAWSAAITMSYSVQGNAWAASGSFTQSGIYFQNAGFNVAALATSAAWNGIAVSASVSSGFSRGGCAGSVV